MKQLLVLGMAVALTGAALAYPTLLGPTGGANLPVARTVEQGKIVVALNFLADGETYNFDFGSYGTETDEYSNTINVAVLYGATPNLEIGATYNNQDVDWTTTPAATVTQAGVTEGTETGNVDLSNWGVNAKYVFADVFPGTNIGVGGLYQFFDSNDMNVYQLYAAATKVFTEGGDGAPVIRGTLGVNYTAFDRDNDESNNTTRPFANVDFVFANKMNVAVEYQLKTDDTFETDDLSSIVLRYPFTDNLTAQLGYTNSFRGVAGSDGHNLLAGVSYAFDTASK